MSELNEILLYFIESIFPILQVDVTNNMEQPFQTSRWANKQKKIVSQENYLLPIFHKESEKTVMTSKICPLMMIMHVTKLKTKLSNWTKWNCHPRRMLCVFRSHGRCLPEAMVVLDELLSKYNQLHNILFNLDQSHAHQN